MRASEDERQKWDKYYVSLSSLEESEAAKKFNAEFGEMISELLPGGNNILEAGCGAGWQSLALAKLGKYNINLMDFSQEALKHAQRMFKRDSLQANFISGDVFEADKPDYDLVFNAGVLEHYTFDQQIAFLHGMASRSRRYVMVLVPNALCYWYWVWRIQKSGEGKWPFGKEVPAVNFSEVFKAADLEFIGQRFVGEGWTEGLVRSLTGLDEGLCQYILAAHCSPLIPKSQKSYLVAALGSVTTEEEGSLRGWEKIAVPEEDGIAEIRAALADALALRINAEHRLRDLQSETRKRVQLVRQLETMRRDLAAVRNSFSFQLGSLLVQALRKPGRNTIFLPYRLAHLCVTGFAKRRGNALRSL